MLKRLQFMLLFAATVFCFFNLGVSAQPENDEPVGAIELILGTNGPFTNVDATSVEDDLAGGVCGEDGAADGWYEPNIDNTVWFTYTGTGGEVTIQSGTGCGDDGANNDTQFALYEGAADGPLVVCNDDIDGSVYYSTITFLAEDAIVYYLLVDGWDGTVGEFCVDVVDPSAVECGNGECEPGETFDNCPDDCPCMPNVVWVDDVNLVGSPTIFFNCTAGVDTLAIPVAVFGAGDNDVSYTVSTNIGSMTNDTTATATIVYALISQTEMDASDGQLLISFEGVGFEGQCLGSLEADLFAAGADDINALCETFGACEANAGTVTVVEGQATVDGDNTADEFITVFILTDEEGGILANNTDGAFDLSGLADGNYFIAALNVEEAATNGNLTLFFILYNSVTAIFDDVAAGELCAAISDVPAAVTIGGPGGGGAPLNDEPAGAIALDLGANGPFTNVDATPGADDLAGGVCGDDGAGDGWYEPAINNTVWFTYAGTGGEVIIQSGTGCGDDGSNNDTQFAIYEGAADGPLVLCNDDIDGSVFYSSINFLAEDGIVYYILVDGWDGTVGEFCMDVVDPSAVECGNGECEAGETFDNCPDDCPCTPNVVWVDDVNLVGSPTIFFNCDAGVDTLAIPVAVFGAGDNDVSYAVNTNIGSMTNDTTATATIVYALISQDELDASDGQLLISFEGVGFEGQCLGSLVADLIMETGGNINDFCNEANACSAIGGIVSVDEATATATVVGDNTDAGFITIFLIVDGDGDILQYNTDGVFDFGELADGEYAIGTLNVDEAATNGNLDLFFILYGNAQALLDDIDAEELCGAFSEEGYTLTIGGAGGAPINDEPDGAIALELGSNGPFTNVDATPGADDLAGGECSDDGAGDGWYEPNIDNTVWFTYTGTGGEVTIQSGTGCGDDGANNDTQFALYEGAGDGPLVLCNDDISGTDFYSSITFLAEDGIVYYLLVDGWDGTVGEFCVDVVDPSAVVCGNGVCEPGETFDNCPDDCPCTPNVVWVDDVNLVGTPDIFFNCNGGVDTLQIPVAVFSAGDNDVSYTINTNIGTVTNDTTATATIQYVIISQDELDASNGQLVISFEGVGFEGQCLGMLEADLIAETGGDISDFCDEANANPTEAGEVTIDDDGQASVDGNNTDAGLITVFILTDLDGNILAFNTDGAFDVSGLADGDYNAYSFNVDEAATNGNLNLFFILYGSVGDLQADIDAGDLTGNLSTPAVFTKGIAGPCTAVAGTTSVLDADQCDDGTISAVNNGDAVIPVDYVLLYVLTSGANLIIEDANATGVFAVPGAGGIYTIHTLVVDPTLDLTPFVGGPAIDVAVELEENGGAICASLDVAGAAFDLEACPINFDCDAFPIVIAVDYACDGDEGVYTLTYSISGGLAQFATENGSGNPDDFFYTLTGDVNDAMYEYTPTNNFGITATDVTPYQLSVTDNAGCTADTSGTPEPCVKTAVELSWFDGRETLNGNLLEWETATETQSHHFIVERSLDGNVFEGIGQVAAAGSSNTTLEYSLLDSDLGSSKTNYYRLASYDNNEDVEYSDIILIESDEGTTTGISQVGPIPGKDQIFMGFVLGSDSEKVIVTIFNLTGKDLSSIDGGGRPAGPNNMTIDISQLPAGMYVIQLEDGKTIETVRFVKE